MITSILTLLSSVVLGFRGAPTITTGFPNMVASGMSDDLLSADGSVAFTGLSDINPSAVDAQTAASNTQGPVTTPTPYMPMKISMEYKLDPVVSDLGSINYTINYTDTIAAIHSLPILRAFLDST